MGLNWLERNSARLVWRRLEKRMPNLKRWVPLISVAILAAQTLLRSLGYPGPADAIHAVTAAVGLTTDTETATLVTTAVGATSGLAFKCVALWRKANSPDEYVRRGLL